MLQKIRFLIPLIFVIAFLLVCTGIGLSSKTQTETINTEPNALQSIDLQSLQEENTLEKISADPYYELLDQNGYYDTGDSGYVLTDAERDLVERAVMCEAGGEGERGEMMIAQSILDGTLRNGFNIAQDISAYQIVASSYCTVSDEVRESVRLVFDEGKRVTMEKTDLWYNPGLVASLWHEEQHYVVTVGNHRFFWMNNDI